ncbi:hypothetical protein KP509_07G041700 [Ceratopteris richardii]|uniref:Lipoxygenase n=1 Tax=Ceratopteris richardii TaxID=49495 RepID=A0A8T2UDT2_CERRI|nr:hypothetical protein KP509_07G041700 [Ceratopteris richardii]
MYMCSDKAYLPSQTPEGLAKYRDMELKVLQGDGEGERKWVDRIYDYDVYNDLGAPDHGPEYARTTLGGSKEFPYPRRCRTGRKRNESDKFTEKPVSIPELIYVPRDEIFDHIKTQNFAADSIKAISHLISRTVEYISKGKDQFNTMEEVYSLYVNSSDSESHSMRSDDNHLKRKLTSGIFSLLANGKKTGNPSLLKFPLPLIVQKNKDAWSTDAEFARQTIAGMHPFTIQRVKVFPLESKLDPKVYGPPPSSINSHHIEPYLEGMTVSEALKENRLYVLDYHDAFLPYIQKINALTDRKAYASRSMFLLTKEGTLTPVAIELSLPKGTGREDRVFVPPGNTSEKHQQSLWKLAKIHAILNDTAVHQTYSHFVRTHSSIEPIIIASHRQLSAMHPLMVLLLPHFKDTLNINALARKVLLNAEVKNILRGGIIEYTFSSGRYSLELSSILYKDWRFDEQGLPGDLLKRGMAVRDANAKYGLRLLIEDYPYAVDGLEVWDSIETWVTDFIRIFYIRDEDVIQDKELRTWWKEIREKGHGDKKDEPGWPSMDRIEDLVLVVTTIIWLASAHHAAVNFGQYPFAGFMPYRPTVGRKLIPTPNSPEYESFLKDPDAFLLSSISSPAQTIVGLSIIEVLSTHASNEEYLGQRSDTQWTNNPQVMRAFEKFQEKLFKIGQHIEQRNNDPLLKNRYGEVQVPYTLLLPTSKGGITNMGIPNSTSI